MREESKVPHGEAIEELASWVRSNTTPEQLEGVVGNEQARAELAVTLHEVCGRDAQLRYLLTGLSRDPIAQLSALREAVMRAAATHEPATSDDAKATMSGWSERERKLLRS